MILEKLATEYAYNISAGHSLVILLKNAFPINILPRLKEVPEIVTVYCATANPVEIIFVETVIYFMEWQKQLRKGSSFQ